MLVLTRKKSQLIQIGDNIVIKVIRTGPGTVKLGIDAPNDVRVVRGELNEQLVKAYLDAEEETAPASSKQTNYATASGRSRKVTVKVAEHDCRPTEQVEESEPVSHLSRRKTRGCVV